MHRPAKALPEIFAFPTDSRTHPHAVAHELETIVPHIQQIILIDVALHKAAINVRAGGDAAVNQHTADINARTTEEIAVSDMFLVLACIGFTAECQVDTVFTTSVGHKLHHLFHLCAGKL